MKIKVLQPFTDKHTGERYKADAIIEVSEERLAEIKAVSPNLVLAVEEESKPKAKAKKTAKAKTTE